MTPKQLQEWVKRLSALERENARLRTLLDEIHRGKTDPPRTPKRYDEAAQAKEDE